ncbi:MAG: hypothetical protein V1898_01955 [Patescibacteria group bacterium]
MTYSTQSNIPIELMPGIGTRTAKVLRKLEIRTIGQFKQMPEKVLVELFGPSIKLYHAGYNFQRKTKLVSQSGKTNIFFKLKLASSFIAML